MSIAVHKRVHNQRRLSTVRAVLCRLGFVLVGAVVLIANNSGAAPGTVLGFVPPVTGEAIGFDFAKLVIAGFGLYCVYRGIRRGPRPIKA